MLKIWDKKKSIIMPNGTEHTPEQIMSDPNFGFARYAEVLLEQFGGVTVAIDNISLVLASLELDENLSGQAALDAIIAAKAKQKEEAAQPSLLNEAAMQIAAVIPRIIEAGDGYLMRQDLAFIAELTNVAPLSGLDEQGLAIAQTHRWLKAQLREGMEWKDGNVYTVTERKQGFLQAQLLLGQMQAMQGVPPEDINLRWNSTGQSHTDWNFAELTQLAVAIQEHVYPLVSKQQQAETKIMAARTPKEIQQILRDFPVD